MPIHSAPNSGSEEPKVADIFVAHHRDTESTERTFFFARSGDADRAKERSTPGTAASPKGHIPQCLMD